MGGGHIGIAERGIALQLLDHGLVFLAGLHGGHAEGDDLDAAQIPPLGGEHFVEGVGDLGGVAGQRGVTDAHVGDLGKGGLQSGEQLGLQLAVQLISGVGGGHIAANVGVEQQGVGDPIAVLAKAADGDVDIQADVGVHHTEGNGRRRAVLVAGQLLGVEVIHSLVLGDLSAEGKAFADLLEHGLDTVAQVAGEDGRLGGGVIDILAGDGADVHDLALLHDQHALAVGHGDHRAAGDDIVAALVGGAAGRLFLPLDRKDIVGKRFTVKIFLPLICQNTADSAETCLNKTHDVISFQLMPQSGRNPYLPN